MSTRPPLDFEAIKKAVSHERLIEFLGLRCRRNGQQYRCQCPAHGGTDRSLAITPKQGWYCHQVKEGSYDAISLYAHVKELSNYDAAAELAAHFNIGNSDDEPRRSRERSATDPPARERSARAEKSPPQGGTGAMKPLDYLTTDHPAIELLGLTEDVCAALGVGFANRGTMNGRVVFPLRLESGALVGYIGLATKADQVPLLKLPDNLAEKLGAGERVEEIVEPPKSKDELRKLLRVV